MGALFDFVRPAVRTVCLAALFLVSAGCSGRGEEWKIDGPSTPGRAVEAFLNHPGESTLVSEQEFKTRLFSRLPERFRQGGRMNADEGWTIEQSFRALVLSRLEGMRAERPVRLIDMPERMPREQRDGIEIIYPGPVSVQAASGQKLEIPYVRLVVCSGGRCKAAVLGPGD